MFSLLLYLPPPPPLLPFRSLSLSLSPLPLEACLQRVKVGVCWSTRNQSLVNYIHRLEQLPGNLWPAFAAHINLSNPLYVIRLHPFIPLLYSAMLYASNLAAPNLPSNTRERFQSKLMDRLHDLEP